MGVYKNCAWIFLMLIIIKYLGIAYYKWQSCRPGGSDYIAYYKLQSCRPGGSDYLAYYKLQSCRPWYGYPLCEQEQGYGIIVYKSYKSLLSYIIAYSP